jgi:hypothetical protein
MQRRKENHEWEPRGGFTEIGLSRGVLPRLRGRGVATRGARLACEADLAAAAIPICGHFTPGECSPESFRGSGLRFVCLPFAPLREILFAFIRGPFSRY